MKAKVLKVKVLCSSPARRGPGNCGSVLGTITASVTAPAQWEPRRPALSERHRLPFDDEGPTTAVVIDEVGSAALADIDTGDGVITTCPEHGAVFIERDALIGWAQDARAARRNVTGTVDVAQVGLPWT